MIKLKIKEKEYILDFVDNQRLSTPQNYYFAML
jgi:hypothetical protein